MTASLLLRATLLLFLLPVALGEAKGAVQPPPANCLLPNCILGTSANGKWVAQPFSGGGTGSVGPAGPQGPAGAIGATGAPGPAGTNGGPFVFKTYTVGMALAPGFWYGVSGTANIVIPLPAAGTAPWTNPANVCFTNYGTGQVSFASVSAITAAPVFLGQNQTVCLGIDDLIPAGWKGDGGN